MSPSKDTLSLPDRDADLRHGPAHAGPLAAQVTLEPDGRWRYLLTAGANVSSGNNDAGSLNLAAESAQQTPYDKWTWSAKADHARSAGVATTDR